MKMVADPIIGYLLFLLLFLPTGVFAEEGNDVSAVITAGNACWKAENYSCAIANWNNAVSFNPGLNAQIAPFLAGAYAKRGAQYYLEKKYSEAVTDFDEVLRLEPDSTEIKEARRLAARAASNNLGYGQPSAETEVDPSARPRSALPAQDNNASRESLVSPGILAGIAITVILVLLGLSLACVSATPRIKVLGRVMSGLGVIAACGMLIAGLQMMREGDPINMKAADNRELMHSIWKYNPDGYDKDGYDKNGYDKDGYDKNGYDKDGYDKNGYDKDGYDKNGRDRNNCDRSGICLMNWNKANAYCKQQGKRLPTVKELQNMYENECTGGRRAKTCYGWFWSSEETGSASARVVNFYYGYVYYHNKRYHYHVRCR
ncbi:MAG: hypothetical protein L6420_10040 [Elusimicrobia bacterium]|nr:hypothetical protein [Elusimicrobiota bacterium]